MFALNFLSSLVEGASKKAKGLSRNQKLALGAVSSLVLINSLKSALRRPKELIGKTIFITGAASGVGKSLATFLAREGAKVVVADTDLQKAEELASLLIHENFLALAVHCDVASVDSIKTAASIVRNHFGNPEILIHNAGKSSGMTLLESTVEGIEETHKVNLLSHYYTIKEFLPDMIAANEGHIVTICSTTAFFAVNKSTDFSATEFGVFGLNESLRNELRVMGSKVKTTCICPNSIGNNVTRGSNSNAGTLKPDFVAMRILKAIKYDEEVVVIPKHIKGLILLKALLKPGVFDKIYYFLGLEKVTETGDKQIGNTDKNSLVHS